MLVNEQRKTILWRPPSAAPAVQLTTSIRLAHAVPGGRGKGFDKRARARFLAACRDSLPASRWPRRRRRWAAARRATHTRRTVCCQGPDLLSTCLLVRASWHPFVQAHPSPICTYAKVQVQISIVRGISIFSSESRSPVTVTVT